MRIAVAADELVGVAEAVVAELRKRGHDPILHGALNPDERADWAWASEKAARGARRWNDANVLALSLRLTSAPLLTEILDGWFTAEPSTDPTDKANITHVDEIS